MSETWKYCHGNTDTNYPGVGPGWLAGTRKSWPRNAKVDV